MRKEDLVKRVSKKADIETDTARKAVEASFKIMGEALSEHDKITIRGFGTLFIQKRAEKKARDIGRDKTIVVPEHYKPAFKPSDKLMNKVNKHA